MTGHESKQRILDDLQRLSFTEQVDLFHRLFEGRKRVDESHAEVDDAFCIAIGGYSGHSGRSEVVLWAYPKEGLSAYTDAECARGPFEEGQCPTCAAIVTSLGKVAICPICGSEVECT